MAETTSAINACKAQVEIDDGTGSLTDISGSANSFTIDVSRELGDYRTFDGNWVRRLACKKDGGITLNLLYTTSANEAWDLLKDWFFNASGDEKRTIRLTSENGESGADQYEAEVYVESFSIPFEVSEAGPVQISASLMPDGAISLSSLAT